MQNIQSGWMIGMKAIVLIAVFLASLWLAKAVYPYLNSLETWQVLTVFVLSIAAVVTMSGILFVSLWRSHAKA